MGKPNIHELKIRSEYFRDVCSFTKNFEVRNTSDRTFQVGDVLMLKEINENGDPTGSSVQRTIGYILNDPEFCREGFAVLGFKLPRKAMELAKNLSDRKEELHYCGSCRWLCLKEHSAKGYRCICPEKALQEWKYTNRPACRHYKPKKQGVKKHELD